MDKVLEKLAEIQATQREQNVIIENQSKILDKHSELLEKYGETLLRNTMVVEEHEKGSIALQRRTEMIEEDLEPIRDHVKSVGTVMKVLGWTAAFTGFVLTLLGIIAAVKQIGG